MKRTQISAVCGLLLLFVTVVSGKIAPKCQVTIRLVDSKTGAELSGLVRIIDQNGKAVRIHAHPDHQDSNNSILSRGIGVPDQAAIERWSVVINQVRLQLPCESLTVEAFSGLETELARHTIDLTSGNSNEVTIPLTRFYSAAEHQVFSANTHLHLSKLDRKQADQYLLEIPRADGLDVLFVSYLERAKADREYITNRYSMADLKELQRLSGTVFGNGEEHRHNLRQQQGYGHVMLLDIPRLIQPVSFGQDITKGGTDGFPLQRGIDRARQDRATIVWCHNTMGLERLANQVTGRLDAQNIFDGSAHGSFEDGFYRSLNAGLKVPFSTGTDWFMYDFSRTYARVDGPLTVESWLQALSAGRSYITNGTFLEFHINHCGPGDRINLDRPDSVEIEARGIGRNDFERIEVIQNGKVVRTQTSRQNGGHYVADLKWTLPITEPCWLALRIPPPPVEGAFDQSNSGSLSDIGRPLFAHTSAINVNIGGRSYFDRAAALGLLADMRESLEIINKKAEFADEIEKAQVVEIHLAAIAEFERRLSGVNHID